MVDAERIEIASSADVAQSQILRLYFVVDRMTTALSITLRSCRTLPGQLYESNLSRAASLSVQARAGRVCGGSVRGSSSINSFDVAAPLAKRRNVQVRRRSADSTSPRGISRPARNRPESRLVAAIIRTSTMISLASADGKERVSFHDSQQLGLALQSHFADFIQEQRAGVGLLKPAHMIRLGAGERSSSCGRTVGFPSARAEWRRN